MLEIRRARIEDADGLADVYEAAWNAAHAQQIGRELGELVTRTQVVEAFADSLAKTGDAAQILVANSGGALAGLAVVAATGHGVGELTHLYVHPDRWGQGIGTALHASSLRELEGMDASTLTLWVAEANQRARDFYHRARWTPDGETRQSPLGPTELHYTMSL